MEDALGAARALYGPPFNPAITLKALAYFQDGGLASLPDEVKSLLVRAATKVSVLPVMRRLSDTLTA
ncbi:MAG: hypothetical protein HYU36_12855 [Planctomycetes bacterium]|nr:hypothetical protein [Planctomycetota bacterium]